MTDNAQPMAGRGDALDELSGDGLVELRSRIGEA